MGLLDNHCRKFSIYSRFKGFTGIDFYNFNSIILLLQLILVFGGHNKSDFLEYYAKYAALFSLLVITSTVNVRTHVQTAQFANIPGNAAEVSGS